MRAAQALLAELRDRGVALRAVGDRLRFSPKAVVTPEQLERMAACKSELIALLAPEPRVEEPPIPEYGDGDRPSVHRCPTCRELDFMRPLPRGMWCCARCHPYEGLAASEVKWWPRVKEVVSCAPSDDWLDPIDQSTRPGAPCSGCLDRTFWRLKPAGPWLCTRCHPPLPAPELIETVTMEGS